LIRTAAARLAALFAAIAVLLGACAPAPAIPAPATPAPVRGGTLVFALSQEPPFLLPGYTTQTAAGVILNTVFDGLTGIDPEGNYIAILAKQVPSLANGGVKMLAGGRMAVTYDLVDGVRWADGSPFTSADVKFTWELFMKDSRVVSREGYDLIESIDTPTPVQAVVNYRQLYAPFLTRFGAILPKAVLEKEADLTKAAFARLPMGTGPFKVTEFVAGDHVTVERNPQYRNKERPYLDRIIFRIVPSKDAAVAQLKAAEVDGVWSLTEAQVPDIEKNPAIRVLTAPSATVERIELNQAKPGDPADPRIRHPVLGDRAVRRALNLATPKQQIIDKLLFGRAKVGTSPIALGWASPKGLTQEAYDSALAAKVLDDAGWVKGADGIRSKGGVRASITITTTTDDRLREQVQQILVDEWRRIGVALSIKNMPSSVLLSNSWTGGDPRKRGNFDAVLYASTPQVDPHTTMSQRYTSSSIPTAANSGLGQNFTRFSNSEADAAINEAGLTADPTRRADLYAKALRLLNEDVAIIWLYDRQSIDAFRSNVGGVTGNAWLAATYNAADWWIKR